MPLPGAVAYDNACERAMELMIADMKQNCVRMEEVISLNVELHSAKEIIDYMHNEKAYIETKPGEIIPFSLAKEIREF